MTERSVRVAGVDLAVIDEGEGPAVLCVHGLSLFKETWAHTIGALSASRRVIAPDLPGFGASEARHDLPYGIPFFSDVLCELLDALGVDEADWVGNSMGGQTSAYTAAHRPDRVRRLVLVDPAGGDVERIRPMVESGGVNLDAYEGPVDPEAMRMVTQAVLFHTRCEGVDVVAERWLARAACADGAARRHATTSSTQSIVDTPVADFVERIEAPTLVVWGAQDVLVPPTEAAVFTGAIAGSRHEVIDACGHLPQLERPDAFNPLLAEFLSIGP